MNRSPITLTSQFSLPPLMDSNIVCSGPGAALGIYCLENRPLGTGDSLSLFLGRDELLVEVK